MNPIINTIAAEKIVNLVNDQGIYNMELETNVIIGDVHYMEFNIIPNKPINFIEVEYKIIKI